MGGVSLELPPTKSMSIKNKYQQLVEKEEASFLDLSPLDLHLVQIFPNGAFAFTTQDEGSGLTAVCLEICSLLQKSDYISLVIDIRDTLYIHRLRDLDPDKTLFTVPRSKKDLYESLFAFREVLAELKTYKACIYVDTFSWLGSLKDVNLSPYRLAAILKSMFSAFSPIILIGDHWLKESLAFNRVYRIEKGKLQTSNDGEVLGNFSSIIFEGEEQSFFVEHYSGRISKGFLSARQQILNGASANGTLIYEEQDLHIKEVGLWNFVRAVDTALFQKQKEVYPE